MLFDILALVANLTQGRGEVSAEFVQNVVSLSVSVRLFSPVIALTCVGHQYKKCKSTKHGNFYRAARTQKKQRRMQTRSTGVLAYEHGESIPHIPCQNDKTTVNTIKFIHGKNYFITNNVKRLRRPKRKFAQ